uniref:CSON013468 protein n=1 Tax=Culicoides sonorensis TaxID=179676 RepID=A0A336KST9_CULSO
MKLCDVEDQYKKFPDLKKEDVQKLLNWCSNQAHLPKNITELEVILFLHSNYYKIEAAKVTIENYYTSRTNLTKFFGSRDIKSNEMMVAHDVFTIVPLPKLTSKGYKVFLGRLHNPDPSKFVMTDAIKLFNFFYDSILLEEGCTEGHVIVFDMTGVTLSHILRLQVMPIKHYFFYLQEALPFRLKGLYFINIVPFVDKLVFLMKPFMKKELWDVFHLDSNMDAVYERIDAEVFPMDYEKGQASSLEYFHDTCYNHLVESRDYFLNDEKTKKVNEKLRGSIKKIPEQDLRALDID